MADASGGCDSILSPCSGPPESALGSDSPGSPTSYDSPTSSASPTSPISPSSPTSPESPTSPAMEEQSEYPPSCGTAMAALDDDTPQHPDVASSDASSPASDIYDFDNELQYEQEFKPPEKYSSHKQKPGLGNNVDHDEGLDADYDDDDEDDDDDDNDLESKLADFKYLQGKVAEQSDAHTYSNCVAGGEEEEDDDEDSSSGFGSGGVGMSSYDNLSGVSYGTIGGEEENAGGQVDVGALGSLIMEPGHGLMLEDDDFGDNVEDDDDMDTPVEKLQRRSGCINSKARENVCISIRTTLQQVMECPEDVRSLMDLFKKLAADQSQSVRIELVEQIPQLAVLCHEFPLHLSHVMDDHLLPLTLHYVTNPVAQLRKTTQAALLVMLEQRLLAEAQVRHVCQEVAHLTLSPHLGTDIRGERSEEDRADALALLSRMAPILGRPLTEEYFTGRLAALCADTSSNIRKICAANFGEFTTVCGTETTEILLLSLFVSLCKDSVWEVRKACSESFMAVSANCLPATRYSSLSPIFVNLLDDHSRWVRVSAFQHLGMFISTFAAPEAINRRPDTYEQPQILSSEPMDTSEGELQSFPSVEASDDTSSTEEQPSTAIPSTSLELSPSSKGPAPLGFLTDTRPHSSPLPSVNLLEQPYLGDQPDYESYNAFNYWRMPLPQIDLDDLVSATSADTHCGEQQIEERAVDCGQEGDKKQAEDKEVTTVQESVSSLSVEDPEPRPVSPRRSRRQQQEEEQGLAKGSTAGGLETASEPVTFHEVLAEGSSTSSKTASEDNCRPADEPPEGIFEDDFNISNDSSDSDDTIIEMSTFNQALLSVEDDDNTSEAFKEGVRRRGLEFARPASDHPQVGSNETKNNIWLIADLAAAAIDSSAIITEELDIANKVRQQDVVPQNLLEQFLLMTDPRRAETEEKEITRHCAFAMPAVTLTLGRENWHVLRDTYRLLSSNYQWRVRRTLAYSMHEMAAILGGAHATADILPLYQDFTANEPECVRVGLLENLAQFVRVMPPSVRREMLPNMATFYGANDRRQRQEFGNQLAQLLKLYPPADVDQHLKDFCITLLTDNVVYNRQYVYGLISLLVERLGCEGDTCYVVGVCQALTHDFAHNSKWSRRQTFVFVAGRVFADGVMDVKVYCDHLLPSLLSLAQDRVPNVRLAVAEVMTNHIVGHHAFSNPIIPEAALVMETYGRLQRDPDRDVRHFAASPIRDERFASDPFEEDYHVLCHSEDDSQHGEEYSRRQMADPYSPSFSAPFNPSSTYVRHNMSLSSLFDNDRQTDHSGQQLNALDQNESPSLAVSDDNSQFSSELGLEDSTC